MLDDVAELLDPHGTLLDARAARGALPELLLGDEVVEQPMLENCGGARSALVAFAVKQRVVRELRSIAHEERGLLHQPVTRVDDDLARAQHLPGEMRGTHRGAAAALGARVPVEQVLPRHLIDVRGPELLDILRLEIEETNHALRAGPLRVREIDVRNRRDDVQVLRERQIVEKCEHEQCMRPPEHGVRSGKQPRRQRAQRHREHEREGLRARDRVRIERELQRVHREHGHHQPAIAPRMIRASLCSRLSPSRRAGWSTSRR